jgi:phosphoglycerate dehydrogenase-like enzyme
MGKILIRHDIGKENMSWLKDNYPQFEFHMQEHPEDKLIAEAEIIAGWVDSEMLGKADSLKWFHSTSAGVDSFLGDVERLRGDLTVTNSAGIYGVPISEHLLAMMLAFAHRIDLGVRNMPLDKWGGLPHCRELHGETVGIVGFGDIGSHLARLLSPFSCEVLAFKRTPAEKPENVSEMLYGEDGLDELMTRSGHVCICLPGAPATRPPALEAPQRHPHAAHCRAHAALEEAHHRVLREEPRRLHRGQAAAGIGGQDKQILI